MTIKDLAAGQKNVGITCILTEKNIINSYDTKYYLSGRLMDSTSDISCVKWNIDETDNLYVTGDILDIIGDIDEYKGKLQIKIRNVRISKSKLSKYLPRNNLDKSKLMSKLLEFILSIKHEGFKTLLLDIVNGDESELYTNVPAGLTQHHAYLHGLLEHSLSVAEICSNLYKQNKILNRDLIITASLVHDIGKIFKFGNNEYKRYDTMNGHVAMGADYLSKKMDRINSLSQNSKQCLLHCVLSHHRSTKDITYVKPAILEAVILNHADTIDSLLNNCLHNRVFNGKYDVQYLEEDRNIFITEL